MATRAEDSSYIVETKRSSTFMTEQRMRGSKNDGQRVPPPPQTKRATNCVQQVADAVLELNRELVAQNIWLRGKLTAGMNESNGKQSDADEELRLENKRLKQQVQQLESKLERKKEIALVSATVVDSRIAYRDNQQFVEYKVQLETDSRGTLFVWHRYSTFRKLAESMQTKQGHPRKSVPELPSKQLFGNFSEKIIQERVIKLNQFLEAAINADHLQWGIRVDADICVYKRCRRSTTPPSSSLKTKAWTLPSRESDVHQYALVTSAKVVDSRIQKREERSFIEYQFKVKTDGNNTLLVWHRYRALYDWAELMQQENPCQKIPQLPSEEPFGSFSKHIQHQTPTLDAFFKRVVKADNLQYITKVDGDTFVCKLRVKDAAASQDLDSANPLASVTKLFALKSIVQRQRKRSIVMLHERKMAQAS
ncbi:hypothetical protein PHYPSEUDO_011789 [Phytophthora pseudosyringae]|uniref:PX domain-containing protein n=1 Tax=Phytophthora pseudosyringae TaxID=221518 RepID=A0A8T1W9B5_9STRA|nr:hypothetical protein PHYPSEUDO_011789 [Phytophthora pseudosyringae]